MIISKKGRDIIMVQILEFSCLGEEISTDEGLTLQGIAADIIVISENSINNISGYLKVFVCNGRISVKQDIPSSIKKEIEDIIIVPNYVLVSIDDKPVFHKVQMDIEQYLPAFEGKELTYNPEIAISKAEHVY